MGETDIHRTCRCFLGQSRPVVASPVMSVALLLKPQPQKQQDSVFQGGTWRRMSTVERMPKTAKAESGF